ncbi:hypothetical protein SAMN06296036_1066 [Pseudobacteriovorax antillogorgiicola]|uniref:Uncharacterized protein n=1 Tax=Pseudobacteriovorax antillogorgiicola TaxID=1513793 RepID=A0A1Y6BK79_9BACT|nr:hypothetical protein EDD56_106237 [Pseudobacteriovorax antillogorgiicola]SMF15955.1 hypothetical protein SAMN06296036_1066 [Pseudobacteriovorax antillogorgiicola]
MKFINKSIAIATIAAAGASLDASANTFVQLQANKVINRQN